MSMKVASEASEVQTMSMYAPLSLNLLSAHSTGRTFLWLPFCLIAFFAFFPFCLHAFLPFFLVSIPPFCLFAAPAYGDARIDPHIRLSVSLVSATVYYKVSLTFSLLPPHSSMYPDESDHTTLVSATHASNLCLFAISPFRHFSVSPFRRFAVLPRCRFPMLPFACFVIRFCAGSV